MDHNFLSTLHILSIFNANNFLCLLITLKNFLTIWDFAINKNKKQNKLQPKNKNHEPSQNSVNMEIRLHEVNLNYLNLNSTWHLWKPDSGTFMLFLLFFLFFFSVCCYFSPSNFHSFIKFHKHFFKSLNYIFVRVVKWTLFLTTVLLHFLENLFWYRNSKTKIHSDQLNDAMYQSTCRDFFSVFPHYTSSHIYSFHISYIFIRVNSVKIVQKELNMDVLWFSVSIRLLSVMCQVGFFFFEH